MSQGCEERVMVLEERLHNHLHEAAQARQDVKFLADKIDQIHGDLLMLKSFVAGAGFVFGLIGSAVTYIWDRIANH